MNLSSNTIIKRTELTIQNEIEMFKLMTVYYDNLMWENFIKSLDEKEWVVVLKNENEEIKGFSTIMIIDIELNGKIVKAVFSGDTVIDQKYWGNNMLQVIWAKFVIMSLPKQYPNNKIYWILISKGYKTYRYLSTHFKEFYPHYNRPMPEYEKKIIDAFGKIKYPNRYDAQTGIIYNDGSTDSLKQGVAEPSAKHLEDPHIRHFVNSNPGHSKGDELVCIAWADFDNLNPGLQTFLSADLGQESSNSSDAAV